LRQPTRLYILDTTDLVFLRDSVLFENKEVKGLHKSPVSSDEPLWQLEMNELMKYNNGRENDNTGHIIQFRYYDFRKNTFVLEHEDWKPEVI
jgi:hypothetical protein